ncbi:hypothetical protein B0H11DRAFT_2192317 [Mycena galericulata]|nr:hypothetical protein B0H11DRAFT_2192317 [Mycena galericulata]
MYDSIEISELLNFILCPPLIAELGIPLARAPESIISDAVQGEYLPPIPYMKLRPIGMQCASPASELTREVSVFSPRTQGDFESRSLVRLWRTERSYMRVRMGSTPGVREMG